MQLTPDQKFLVSCDTMKKVNVANFPNVFNLQSVLLEHSHEIRDMCVLGLDRLATLSEPDPQSKQQDLIISKISDAGVIFRMTCTGVKQLAATTHGSLVL